MSDERTEKKKPRYPPNHLLKQARLERDLRPRELAELIGLGDPKTIGRWERGTAFPSPIFRQRLCKILQKDAEALGLSRKRSVDDVLSVKQPPEDPSTVDEQKTEEGVAQSIPMPAATSETARLRDELITDPSLRSDAAREPFMLPIDDLPLMYQYRHRMIEEVHSIWIHGLLEKSLENTAPIKLELGKKPEAITSPWYRSFQALVLPRESPSSFDMLEAYEDAQGKLLILGEPGSGKTTLLLQLTRTILEHARNDNNHLIPVIFSLASWVKQPIAKWLVEELKNIYHISQTLGQFWIENHQILPLFDGLDEVNSSYYTACVEALNVYLSEHGLVPTVICSRTDDYLNQQKRLLLRSAIIVQPLTNQQIDSYLQGIGNHLEDLSELLSHDPTLRQLARTPLMLRVLATAYQGGTVEDSQAANTLDVQQRAFTTYVIQMFKKRPPHVCYKPKKTIERLQWLARQLHQHNQTRFYIEFMQIDWLPTYPFRQLYLAFAVGSIYGLLSSIGYSISYLPYLPLYRVIIVCLLIAIFNTLLYVFFNDVGFKAFAHIFSKINGNLHRHEKFDKIVQAVIRMLKHRVTYGIFNGLLDGVFVGFFVGPVSGWICGIFSCAFCAALGKLDGEIKCAEHLSWSWPTMLRHAYKFLAGGLLVGLFYGLVTGRAYLFVPAKLLPSLFLGLGIGLIVGLIMSIRGGFTNTAPNLQNIVKPNQGIRNSIRYSLFFGGFFGLAFGLLFGLIYGPVLFLILGNEYRSSFPTNSGLIYGLSDGFIVAAFFWLLSGGIACIQHTFLRLILWMGGSIPWNYSRFLDYCADLALLHKVGGGYIFFHNLFQEYLETLDCSQMEQIEVEVEGRDRLRV